MASSAHNSSSSSSKRTSLYSVALAKQQLQAPLGPSLHSVSAGPALPHPRPPPSSVRPRSPRRCRRPTSPLAPPQRRRAASEALALQQQQQQQLRHKLAHSVRPRLQRALAYSERVLLRNRSLWVAQRLPLAQLDSEASVQIQLPQPHRVFSAALAVSRLNNKHNSRRLICRLEAAAARSVRPVHPPLQAL